MLSLLFWHSIPLLLLSRKLPPPSPAKMPTLWPQPSRHTYNFRKYSHASVGLAQARPNYPHWPICNSLQGFNTSASPRIWTCDTRPLLLAWAGHKIIPYTPHTLLTPSHPHTLTLHSSQAREQDLLMPVHKSDSQDDYAGATVIDPVKGWGGGRCSLHTILSYGTH